jgi:hypothetical protein
MTISPKTFVTNGTQAFNITCQAREVNPEPSYSWDGVVCTQVNYQMFVCLFVVCLPACLPVCLSVCLSTSPAILFDGVVCTQVSYQMFVWLAGWLASWLPVS